MTVLFITILIITGIVPHILDVHSSAANNQFAPRIKESRKMFQNADLTCNIGKLILFKIVLFASVGAASFSLYFFTDAGLLAFSVFPLMAVIAIPTVLHNYKLHKKYKNASMRGLFLSDSDSTFSVMKTVFAFIVLNWKFVLFALVLFAVIYLFSGVRSCVERRKIEKINTNINGGKANVNALETNANRQAVNANKAESEVNRSRENLNRIQNQNFNNVSGKDLDNMAANYR